MTGTTLRSLEYVPAILLRHLGRQFAQKAPDLATLRTLYRRSRTLYEHQRWPIEFMGLRKFDETAQRRLSGYIGERTEASLTRNRLEQIGTSTQPVPHLFCRSSARQRTSLALRVGSFLRMNPKSGDVN